VKCDTYSLLITNLAVALRTTVLRYVLVLAYWLWKFKFKVLDVAVTALYSSVYTVVLMLWDLMSHRVLTVADVFFDDLFQEVMNLTFCNDCRW